MPDDMTGASGAPDAGGDFSNIESIFGPSQSDPAEGVGGGSGQQGANGSWKFAGRDWKGGQTEAEKAYNKLYGERSDLQGTLNTVKKALNDPELLERLADDPRWAPILSKLGIEFANEEMEAEEADGSEDFDWSDVPAPMREAYHRTQVMYHTMQLKEEKTSFEETLGRKMTPQENNAVMKLIQRINDLTVEEAYFLAHRQQVISEASKKGAQSAGSRVGQNGRPKPLPRGIPGMELDLKKPIADMNNEELREHMRRSPEFQKLMER